MTKPRFSLLLTIACLAFVLGGCQGPSYVNIPAESGDVAFNSPNGRTARVVAAKAIDYVIMETPLEGTVQLTMPAGTDSLTYEAVSVLLATGQVTKATGEEGAATIRVTNVRVRGYNAEVDAVRARADGPEQLVTVTLGWYTFDGWKAERIRAWRIPVAGADS